MKIVFMGTPEIATGGLNVLIDQNYDVCAVVTQPDRPKGRGKKLAFSPVKEVAIKHDITVIQPKRARDAEFIEEIKQLNPDLIVVIAFGQILPKEILEIPKYGCINIHVSLLPAYRGAAPINWVIINGEQKTGVTSMYMDEGLDTGDIILAEEFKLDDKITAGELHDIMMEKGAKLLKDTIIHIVNGDAPRIKQDDSKSSYAHMMDKALGHIDFSKKAKEIHDLVRGVNPWPGAYCQYNDLKMKIWETDIFEQLKEENSEIENGTVLNVSDEGIFVKVLDGVIILKIIQVPNKKRMKVSDYIKGNKIEKGIVLS